MNSGRTPRVQEAERNSRRDVRHETDRREETGTGRYGSGVSTCVIQNVELTHRRAYVRDMFQPCIVRTTDCYARVTYCVYRKSRD